ncbi:rho GTPase-activating protein 190-like isoform X9 [Daphnia pulex]|uniref:rho GTPase-activating protein 190-like isoform X9 n=1 Tax=Daphnia pulex TaxID=6669 RepID=UPI001EDD354D|nr:rho GTPase-activating protein 190-like isoform X9 [Daphnia pulex]
MARKTEQLRTLNVSVVGLAGTEKERGQSGLGKSCLCNRFIKSLADDYHVEHISVLSQTDFSGRVINNDHFLYWGETTKQADDGVEYHFQLVEQTEFIDDASFQPFKGGKMEPYVKRCAATKLTSAEKFMYICKNQLGIEKEYEQKVMPDGKFNVDGFICVFDVSMVPSRPIERQLEYTANILANLVKSKKPIVLATTKNDEAFDGFIREAEKLVSRKEFKGSIALVETSAHENVNVDLAFLVLAQMVDKAKNRMRIVPFAEAARSRKDVLDVATEAFQRLIRAQVTDFRALWSATSKKLAPNPDYIHYCNLFGQDDAQRLFRRHVKKLKDEHLARKIKGYMDTLPEILLEFFPDLPSLEEGDWELIKEKMHGHPEFNRYFLDCPADGMSWAETDLLDSTEMRIPFDVLDTSEAEMVFRNHINSLQKEQRFLEYRHQFKSLLQETGYVTPGKTLSEVQVLFMGRECFEALSEADCHHIYDLHQRDITEKARKNFQELLLEHAHLFYQFKSIAPSGTVTQDDIREITEELQEDSRYKSLDRLDNERRLLLLQHLGFVHCPIREHCPAHPNCMDAVIERLISVKAHRPSSWNRHSQWMLGSGGGDNSQLSLVLLGVGDLAHELAGEIRALCDEDEYEMDNQVYSLDYRIIDGDVSLPQNSFRTTDFTPQGCFCVFSNAESFEYIRDSLEKTLLSNLEQEDRLPFQGLPIVIVMAAEPSLSETDYEHLKGEGLNLADNLQCPFIEVSQSSTTSSMDGGKVGAVSTDDGEHNGESPAEVQTQGERFNPHLVSSALRALVTSIQQRAGFLNVCQSSLSSGITDGSCQPDIRIILSMLCADPFSVESVLGPLLSHQCCFLSGERSLTLETFLGDSKRRVEVVVTSYHSADSFRDDLVHGFILVYSTKRKASLATLVAFSQNIPNLPIQILAVTESGGAANAFFNSELSHQLITAGNAAADRLQAHFMTLTASANPKSAIYTPFFKEVWDKKMEIEQAFQLEDASGLNDSGEGTLERPLRRTQPIPPPRHSAGPVYGRCGVGIYGQRSSRAGSNEGSGSEIYERLPTDGSLGDDGEDAVSPTYPDDRRLTPSDDSDLYSTLDRPMQRSKENGVGEHLVKPSHLKTRQKTRQGWMDDSVFLRTRNEMEDEAWGPGISGGGGPGADSYSHRAFTTGRRKMLPQQQQVQVSGHPHTSRKQQQQTYQHPGKLNPKDFANVADAIARMKLVSSGKECPTVPPPPPPRLVKGKESHRHFGSYDGDYSYTSTQDTLTSGQQTNTSKSRSRYRREKERPAVYSDSDSSDSSLDRRPNISGAGLGSGDGSSRPPRKSSTHKRPRRKRAAIPVATPRVPTLPSANSQSTTTNLPPSGMPLPLSARSRGSGDTTHAADKGIGPRDPIYSALPDDDPSMDVASPRERDLGSPLVGFISRQRNLEGSGGVGLVMEQDRAERDPSTQRRKDKAKAKDDEKQEKRRLKEEERQRREREKEKERERKRNLKMTKDGKKEKVAPTLEDVVQAEGRAIPLFLETCVKFIEAEGLDSEGIYRVPGNRAHVDMLFQKLEEDPNYDIHELDIAVNAVATALKDFFKRFPSILTQDQMSEMEEISMTPDRSCRLLALRDLLTKKLTPVSFNVLKFIFQHFVKVTENCKANSMDSKNLAICWWPTLLPFEFTDMIRFEMMRPHLEDTVQAMIDQFPFLFLGKDEIVMV